MRQAAFPAAGTVGTAADEAEAAERGDERQRGLMHFIQDRPADEISACVLLKVKAGHHYDTARALAAAEDYRARTGRLDVPRRHREAGVELGVQLDTWRTARRTGTLDEQFMTRLEALGVMWEPRRSLRDVNWAGTTAYALRQGHLLPRKDETTDVEGREIAVGRLMTEARRRSCPSARSAALDALGVPWRITGPWDVAWQRMLVLLDHYAADGGPLDDLVAGSR
jgi:hypothetical protein